MDVYTVAGGTIEFGCPIDPSSSLLLGVMDHDLIKSAMSDVVRSFEFVCSVSRGEERITIFFRNFSHLIRFIFKYAPRHNAEIVVDAQSRLYPSYTLAKVELGDDFEACAMDRFISAVFSGYKEWLNMKGFSALFKSRSKQIVNGVIESVDSAGSKNDSIAPPKMWKALSHRDDDPERTDKDMIDPTQWYFIRFEDDCNDSLAPRSYFAPARYDFWRKRYVYPFAFSKEGDVFQAGDIASGEKSFVFLQKIDFTNFRMQPMLALSLFLNVQQGRWAFYNGQRKFIIIRYGASENMFELIDAQGASQMVSKDHFIIAEWQHDPDQLLAEYQDQTYKLISQAVDVFEKNDLHRHNQDVEQVLNALRTFVGIPYDTLIF